MSYEGPAHVGDLPVKVHLSGRWEPVDGRYHWGGVRVTGIGAPPWPPSEAPEGED